MAIGRGIYKEAYTVSGSLLLAAMTILLSEDADFVFLSEDENDILIAEIPEMPSGIYKDAYGVAGVIPVATGSEGIIKQSYMQEGTYEREEL